METRENGFDVSITRIGAIAFVGGFFMFLLMPFVLWAPVDLDIKLAYTGMMLVSEFIGGYRLRYRVTVSVSACCVKCGNEFFWRGEVKKSLDDNSRDIELKYKRRIEEILWQKHQKACLQKHAKYLGTRFGDMNPRKW